MRLLVLLMALGLGQASAPKIGEIVMAKDDKGGTVIYAQPRDVVFDAALRVAAAEGVVTLTEKSSGVISTNIGGSHQQGRQARLSITVSADGDRTTVSLTTQGFQWSLKGGWGDGKAAKRYFADLNQALGLAPTK